MRIFSAGIVTETNTFAPWPTGLAGFENGELHRGSASDSAGMLGSVARVFRQLAAHDGHEFTEGLFVWAQPSGPTLQHVWEALRDEIVADVRARGRFDVILLFMHGAMVATECDDCEHDLVAALRDAVGSDTAIGVELDPHCHLSQALVDLADAVVLAKEYPHTDFAERARELYALCVGKANGLLRPTSALFDCKMIGFYPTANEPMAQFLALMREAERREGVLSVSFAHGFPWGDVADTGSKMLVVTQADMPLAARTAQELGRWVYQQREQLLPRLLSVDDALDLAERSPGRIVLADTADNPGGGAPGDNVSLLRAMLARRSAGAVLGAIWDPMAVATCVEAGVGAHFALRLGGKCGPASGDPIDLEVTVKAIRADHDQAGLGAARAALGLSVWLDCAGIAVVVCSVRSQLFAPDAFTGLGIGLRGTRLVVVKSSQHFRAHFAPLADRVIMAATPGAIQMNFVGIDYRKRRDLNFFPRVHDPLA